MNQLLMRLGAKARRGSKPRCHYLTHGTLDQVAAKLTALAEPFCEVHTDDCWMPVGFDETAEAELDKADRLLSSDVRSQLEQWWLAPASKGARTPNFDIASTCTVEGKSGLLLVEAKAHTEELKGEVGGRKTRANSSDGRKQSHEQIGMAITEACNGLETATDRFWNISRDSHYQLSNRFAWAWKLTELGFPVVLVYLGFLNAHEMADRGDVLTSHQAWEALVKDHSQSLLGAEIWGQSWVVNHQPFAPLIRSLEIPLDDQ